MIQKDQEGRNDDITTAKICRNDCGDRNDQQGNRRTLCITAKSCKALKELEKDADHDLRPHEQGIHVSEGRSSLDMQDNYWSRRH